MPHTFTQHGPGAHYMEAWYKRVWRPAAAFIYLFVCLFDFVVMPSVIERNNQVFNIEAFEAIYQFEDPSVQIAALNRTDLGGRTWSPITLLGGGLFHIAFGAILTGAAVTRGMEKKAAIQNEHNFK